MKISLIQCLMVMVFVGASLAHDADAQEVLEQKVTLRIENQNARKALQAIEKQTNVRFAYRPSSVPADQKITLVAADDPLSQVLDRFIKPFHLRYEVVGRQIILRPIKKTSELMSPVMGTAIREAMATIAVERKITGTVVDEEGTKLAGVSVIVQGTPRGTTTNGEGAYEFVVPDNAIALVYSFVGFKPQEVTIGDRSVINVTLQTDVNLLEEAVVIGYGSVKKKDLVGSVGVAKSEDFGEVTATNAQQLLQGKLAGVQVVNSNGLPGQGTRIFIRGTGTFTNPDPLYVIDGIQGGDINSVPWQDIESMTVLKDAASVAIYGARAANGVVIVTTKRGKSGVPRISYNFQYGVSRAAKRFDLLNSSQYIDLLREGWYPNGFPDGTVLDTPEAQRDVTNWQDEIFQTAPQTNHYININGGSEISTYSASIGYENQDGIFKPYNFQRVRLRLALDQNVGRFKFGQNINTTYNVYSGATYDLSQAVRMPPYAPVRDPSVLGGYYNVTRARDVQDAQNPATWINNRESKSRSLNITAQIFGEVRILDWLKFRSQAQVNFNAGSNWNYRREFESGNLYYAREVNEGSNFGIGPLFENFLTVDKSLGKNHKINVVVGATYANGGRYRNLNVQGSQITNDEIMNIGAAGQKSVSGSGASTNTNVFYSYFSRLQYDLMDKYIFTASIRRDYSPAFGANNRYGDFPAFGVAWKVIEEDFMKGQSILSDLKLRASWGKTGNDRIGLFRTSVNVFRGYSPGSPGYSLGTDKGYVLGSTLSEIANPDLRWEETTQTDIGLDVGFFNNRLNITADYYNRLSDGLLINVLLPKSTGLGNVYNSAQIPLNAASVVNRGLELAATFRGSASDFRYALNVNASFNHNEVLSLGTDGAVPIRGGGFNDVASMTKTDVGTPIGAFWGFRMDHVVVDQSEVARYNEIAATAGNAEFQKGLKPGDIVFKDLSGDGQVTEADQEFLGSPIPKMQYGGNVELGYKNFDLMIGLTGVSGVQIINSTIYYLEGTNKVFNHGVGVLDRWRQPGDIAKNPKANQGANGGQNLRASDRYVESGDYLRFRNITLGYNLPKLGGAFGKVLQGARLYVTLQNFITLTKYSGLDPEVLSSGGTDYDVLFNRGLNSYTPPIPKTIIVGINLNF